MGLHEEQRRRVRVLELELGDPPWRCVLQHLQGGRQCTISRRGSCVKSSSNRVSQETDLGNGCSVTSFRLRVSDLLLRIPGPGEQARRWLGLETTTVFDALSAAVSWRRKSTYHRAWAGPPSCRCSHSHGHGPAQVSRCSSSGPMKDPR